jgi:hypothetical protein
MWSENTMEVSFYFLVVVFHALAPSQGPLPKTCRGREGRINDFLEAGQNEKNTSVESAA